MGTGTKRVPDQTALRERGAALRIAGWLVLLSNLMVLFYLPAAQKLGRQRPYEIAIAVLIAVGISLVVAGTRLRRAD
jgi:hypothetical protein